jgi:hypothetical protein
MPIDVHPKRKGRTPEEVTAEQKRQAAARNVPAVAAKAGTPVAMPPDNRSEVEKYVDEIAPSAIAGQMVKFSKDGKFVVSETDEEIGPDEDFVALCDETLTGWIRFNGEGEQPTRAQGLLYNGFIMPSRASLGDLDERQWAAGLSGAPEDPWHHQICLVLQSPRTQALYTFVTMNVTGRNGVGKLLNHFNRLRRNDPNSYPVVRLKPSGYMSKKKGVGWVHTPSFQIIGRAPKNSAVVPDTHPAADMGDQIPF